MKKSNSHTQSKIEVSDKDPKPTPIHLLLIWVHWVKLKDPSMVGLLNMSENNCTCCVCGYK